MPQNDTAPQYLGLIQHRIVAPGLAACPPPILSAMDLSIIIVNWKSAGHVKHCLESLRAQTTGLRFEIIVVDNASGDDCGAIVAREFPDVTFVQSEANVGFAKANNLGFQKARGQTLLFLNPDTEPVGTAIFTLYEQLQALPGAGAVGPTLLNSDGTIQTSCVQSVPTILNQSLDAALLPAWFPQARLWGKAMLREQSSAPAEVEVLSGACLMTRRQVFEAVGMFNTGYFMYSEDVDLCYEIRQTGYKIYHVPGTAVIHHGGISSQQSRSEFSSVMMSESVWRFLTRTKGRCYGLAYRGAMMLSALCRLLLLALASPLSLFRGEVATPRKSIRKWLAILGWSVGAQAWIKRNN